MLQGSFYPEPKSGKQLKGIYRLWTWVAAVEMVKGGLDSGSFSKGSMIN